MVDANFTHYLARYRKVLFYESKLIPADWEGDFFIMKPEPSDDEFIVLGRPGSMEMEKIGAMINELRAGAGKFKLYE